MKKLLLIGGLASLVITGCRKIEVDDNGSGGGGGGGNNTENTILSGKINADRTLSANNVYKLRGIVYLVDGATLTIEPGTRIEGEKSTRGALIVTRGTKLIANGTKDKPIVFTSDASAPASGDWGGIVLLGRARNNSSFNGASGVGEIEGGVNNGEGHGLHGGADDNDNSGILKYVRIEYAGYAFLPDKELNSLTMGSVGSGTVLDNIQVSFALDDAYEWFGGTVNASHLIAYKSLDDDFDTDNGFKGKIQFGIIMRDSTRADISQSNGFESDNDANGSSATTLPQTSAIFSNITVIGPRATSNNVGNSLFRRGAHIRRNSSISIFNSIFMGWPTGIHIDAAAGRATDLNITDNNLFIQNTIIAGCAKPIDYSPNGTPTGMTAATALAWFNTAAYNNTIYPENSDVKLTAPFNYSNPDFTPQAGSPVLSGASFTNAKVVSGFKSVTFRGAVGAAGTEDGDWWKGWTSYK